MYERCEGFMSFMSTPSCFIAAKKPLFTSISLADAISKCLSSFVHTQRLRNSHIHYYRIWGYSHETEALHPHFCSLLGFKTKMSSKRKDFFHKNMIFISTRRGFKCFENQLVWTKRFWLNSYVQTVPKTKKDLYLYISLPRDILLHPNWSFFLTIH